MSCQVNPCSTSLRSVRKDSSRNTLSNTEQRLWLAWKRAADAVMSRVARDVSDATGLSGADYGVLSCLVDVGRGTLRQQQLADAMGWHKSRLSHHLSRMETRGLVLRQQGKHAQGNNVLVLATAAGKRAQRAALPVHARSVRAHLLAPIPLSERSRLLALLDRLSKVET